MTYKALALMILALPEEQQNADVTVFDVGIVEANPVKGFYQVDENSNVGDVLDVGHPVLTINDVV